MPTVLSGSGSADFATALPVAEGGTGATSRVYFDGSIIQVLQTVKTNVFSTSSGSWTDWTDMSVAITPSSDTNKILITLTSGVSNDTSNNFQYVKLVRGATDIALGDAVSSVTR